MKDDKNFFGSFRRNFKIGALLLIGMVIIIPIPEKALIILVSISGTLVVAIIAVAYIVKKPFNFSLYPALFLITTIFNMLLNISIVRDVLTLDMSLVPSMKILAGLRNDYLVKCYIVIVVLLAVVTLLIVKGTTRVAEAAARFFLDFLPVKLLAVDVEYSTGAITQEEATARKGELQRESDFYNALDSASKVISGIAKLRIILIVITIIGGPLTGIFFRDGTITYAIKTYPLLGIFIGFTFMLTDLLLSFAMEMIVTRIVKENKMPSDPLSLEIGYGLIPMVDKDRGAELIECLQEVRRQIALDMGFVIPKIRIIDNMVLGSSEYCIKIRGIEVGKGIIKTDNTISDQVSVIAAHFTEIIKSHAAELLDI